MVDKLNLALEDFTREEVDELLRLLLKLNATLQTSRRLALTADV